MLLLAYSILEFGALKSVYCPTEIKISIVGENKRSRTKKTKIEGAGGRTIATNRKRNRG